MIADEYHPHYESIDRDLFQRIAENAYRMANPFRLMCQLYTPDQEAELQRKWDESRANTKGK